MFSSHAQLGEAVRLRQQATGESYEHAQSMLRSAPDTASVIPAAAPEQQRWESYLVGLLAPVFARHDAGCLFGIRSVTPLPDQLLLRLDRGHLATWARALAGAERAGAQEPRMRTELAPRSVKVIEAATGAVVVLDRTFPRQWQAATTVAAQTANGAWDRAVERAVALCRSLYGFEASALLRRFHLVSAAASGGLVHLEVRDETDGRARLFDVGGKAPRAVLWDVLEGAPEALYPACDGSALPALRRPHASGA